VLNPSQWKTSSGGIQVPQAFTFLLSPQEAMTVQERSHCQNSEEAERLRPAQNFAAETLIASFSNISDYISHLALHLDKCIYRIYIAGLIHYSSYRCSEQRENAVLESAAINQFNIGM
jgi:hypothetical protein